MLETSHRSGIFLILIAVHHATVEKPFGLVLESNII